ncbi:MAG: O-antigen ligase family protein [Proteobacteria bacterium]|nr:O-antigen ligase family protein [Pseudomonadota bacterium]
MAREQALTATALLVTAILAQSAGHLLLKYYMPNVAIGGFGFLLVGLIFYYVLFVRRDPFGFILLVYVSSHFAYANNQGGLWNLMTFGILTLYLIVTPRRDGFRQRDNVMHILLWIFVWWNVLGWGARNPMPIVDELLGIAAFFGFILMFRLASNMVITKERFRLFLVVTFFILPYQVMVDLIQRYHLLRWNTPLIGAYSEQGSTLTYGTTNAWGTLVNFELMGEYGALLACLLIPLLSSSLTQRELRFGSNRIVIMIFSCLAIIMLATNRSATILFVVAMAAYYLILSMRVFSAIDRVGRQMKLILVLAFLLPVIGVYIGLHNLEEKFSTLAGENFSVEGVASGKDINRGQTTALGLNRLQNESWWIGYGFGTPRSNVWAWYGVDPRERQQMGLAGFHSLYLSLPELYGWVGALAFLAMIVVTAFRSFTTSMRYRRRKSFLIVLMVGFTVFWGVFLINEYKIDILRNPNYHMLFWIWLGLANSVIKTIRYEKDENSASSPSLASGKKESA